MSFRYSEAMIDKLWPRARSYGAQDLQRSTRKHKKLMVLYKGHWIHFGDDRYEDFNLHKDPERRQNYLNRARGIRDKSGRLTRNDKTKANFWAINLLW